MGNITRIVFAGSAQRGESAAAPLAAASATTHAIRPAMCVRHGIDVRIRSLFISPCPGASRDLYPRSFDHRLAWYLEVDVEVLPGMLLNRVVLVALDPWVDQHVFVPIDLEVPRRIRGDERRHLAEHLRALWAVGQAARGVVQLVELGKIEARDVGESCVAAVEQPEEPVALGRRVDV